MQSGKFLIVVGGPTASGKTDFAIRLARHFNTVILSADSRQFFGEMNIGTAKPTAEEMAQAPHYFINSRSIESEYSVGDFERDALQLLERLFEEKNVVILAGGSGLYIKALCEGLDKFPEVPLVIRQAVEEEYQEKGLPHLQAELQRIDPAYYKIVDTYNPHRLIRAIAVFRASGQPYSSFLSQASPQRFFTPIFLQLHWPRAELYARIDARVETMMEQGLLEEARSLYPKRKFTALQTVGYQELFEHLDGRLSLEEAVSLIQRNSRRYAKRQLTWYRRDGHWKLLRPEDWELALFFIEAAMLKKWALLYSDEAPGNFTFHPMPQLRGQFLQITQSGKPVAALYLVEGKDAVWLQGPFYLVQEDNIPLAERILLHEVLLASANKKVFALKNSVSNHPTPGLKLIPIPLSGLPDWTRAAAEKIAELYPDAGAFEISKA